jgi:CRISPR-associated protein Cas4
MGALAVELPDYLPARMVNEYTYCPRLFFYEWVDGVFQESVDTIEGAIQHKRVDEKATALPKPEDLPQSIHSRSVTLASESLRVIAKMDLVEAEGGVVTPVDYKHGRPREGPDGLELWPADRAQLALQGIALRENGYDCREGIVYYRMTGQRVRVEFDEALIAETRRLAGAAWALAATGEIPPPLVDSPKCPGCSLVGICLPDETLAVGEAEEESAPQQLELFGTPRRKPVKRAVRALMTPRSELRPLYLNSQGVRWANRARSCR